MLTITREQARQFILAKQGLLGAYRFHGKDGAYAYIRQAGCIQFDPVDVCRKNAELTLQARVKGFKKAMLQELLYTDRKLVDYPDKELSIWPVEDCSPGYPACRYAAFPFRFLHAPALQQLPAVLLRCSLSHADFR